MDKLREMISKIFCRIDFALLTLFVIISQYPYFSNTFVPAHDSMYGFELFYYFYNNLFFHGEIAQWLPYDTFGLPTNHDQIFGLSFVNYIVMFIGWLLQIKDVLILYKVSFLGEQLVLLTGMYLLCSLLFERKSTVFILCIGAVCSTDLVWQPYFDFRMYYMLPLAAYFLVMFANHKRGEFFWLTGITLLTWDMGNVLYFITLWFFVFAIIGIIMFFHDRSLWRCLLQKTNANITFFIICIGLGLAIFLQLKDMTNFAELASRGEGAKNSLGVYIHWGGVYGIDRFLRLFVLGSEKARYVGILPMIFFVWSMLKVRDRTFLAFLSATVALIWLSFGGIFSLLMYYFPGMFYYRHLGLLYGVLKILILICAGYGLENFWSAKLGTRIKFVLISMAVLVFLTDATRITGGWFTDLAYSETPIKDIFSEVGFASLFLRSSLNILALFIVCIICFIFMRMQRKRSIKVEYINGIILIIFLSVYFVDISSFQKMSYEKTTRLDKEYRQYLYIFNVHEMKYQHKRLRDPFEQRQKDAYAFINRPGLFGKAIYTSAHSFLQFDACYSEFRAHMYPKGFQELLSTRKSIDTGLWYVLGCHVSKLRLTSNVIFLDSKKEVKQKLVNMSNLAEAVVLQNVKESDRQRERNFHNSIGRDDQIRVKKFTANQLEFDVHVPGKTGAWLVYADSYHPGWKAFVNGQKEPIYKADLAFKALYLNSGRSTVKFIYQNGLHSFISYLIAGYGLLISIVLLSIFLAILIFGFDPIHYFISIKHNS